MRQRYFLASAVILALSSFSQLPTLKGIWIYAGGKSNGKVETAPTDFKLQRKYTDTKFEAFMLEAGQQPLKYQTGDYQLHADTCLETETFNIQAKTLTGVMLKYNYSFVNDTLKLSGKLPNGNMVQEYWVREK